MYILRNSLPLMGLIVAMSLSPYTAAAVVSPPTPEGVIAQIESWVALIVIVGAFSLAWLLNHSSVRFRTAGTVAAAFWCFGVVAWFAGILTTGVLENPKPNQAPMDSAKTMLLWTQVITALAGGVVLLLIARRQSQSEQRLILPVKNEPARYGMVSRILHWSTAIVFITLIPTGIFSSMIPENVWYRTEYNVFHKTLGLTLFGLLLFRLLWNRLSARPALDSSLKPVERKLARGAHVLLYILLFAFPITGYVMTSMHGYPSYLFSWEIKPFIAESQSYIIWGAFHKYILQYLMYIVLGAHIIGALKHQFIDKHAAAFKRMVS